MTLAVTLTTEELAALMEVAVKRALAGVAPQESNILTREQVAKLLQVHANVVSRYVTSLGLPARKVGGEWRFLRAEVLAWIESRERVKTRGAA